MTGGPDELLDFLLSGIAICGVQGASSADFRRIIDEYYRKQKPRSSGNEHDAERALKDFGRSIHERAWRWVTDHPDIRICYNREVRSLSLSEFEALEAQEADTADATPSRAPTHPNGGLAVKKPRKSVAASSTQPSNKLSSLSASLRQKLLIGSNTSGDKLNPLPSSPSPDHSDDTAEDPQKVHESRKMPETAQESQPEFEEPDAFVRAPRLFASQNRTWIAITGHPIDFKKVHKAEFVLLSIIIRSGPEGITQPELQKLSGQDKRSVPARTNELASKGYIDKRPVQSGHARTSLLTHKKFLKDIVEEPTNPNDVFGPQTLNLTGLVYILNKLLESTEVVQVRQLRKKLGVSLERWNGRAARGALVRLEQTGYLRRFSAIRTHKSGPTNPFVCIQRLREPNEDDINNLKFKRIATGPSANDAAEEEPLEDDNDGDGFMRDMDLEFSSDDDEFAVDGRIPPQWTPDRLLTNLVVDAVDTAGTEGWDGAKIRDVTTGIFWKRPVESLITRMTDNWDENHPRHTRHLAIIRDTGVNDKKRVQYVYRTHENFQKAVDSGEKAWEALETGTSKKAGQVKKHMSSAAFVDDWGFRPLNPKDFHKQTGVSTLAEAFNSKVSGRKVPKLLKGNSSSSTLGGPGIAPSRKNSNVPRPLLTQAERLALGLPAKGRLGVEFESQIRAHRKRTGDPNSIPEKLVKGLRMDTPKEKPKYERRPGPPLLTQAERKARGLPVHGRLSFEVTKKILEEQGRRESLTHMKRTPEAFDDEDAESVVDGTLVDDSDERLQNGRQTSTPAFTNGAPNRSSAHSQTVLQSSEVDIEEATPRKKRSYRKRTIDENDTTAGGPKKKMRRDSDRSIDQTLGDHSVLLAQVDGAGERDAALGPGHSVDPSSPMPADETEMATGGPVMTSSTNGSRFVSKKGAKQKPQAPLTEAALHAQASQTRYNDRAEPGLYTNPYVTKLPKIGRGRPMKMFIATFRLPGLQNLDWFVPGSTPDITTQKVLSKASGKSGANRRPSTVNKNATASPAPSAMGTVQNAPAATRGQFPTSSTARRSLNHVGAFMSPINLRRSQIEMGVQTGATLLATDTRQADLTPTPTDALSDAMDVNETSQAVGRPSEAASEPRGSVNDPQETVEHPIQESGVEETPGRNASVEVRATIEEEVVDVMKPDVTAPDTQRTAITPRPIPGAWSGSPRPASAIGSAVPTRATPLRTFSRTETPNTVRHTGSVAGSISRETASRHSSFVVDDDAVEAHSNNQRRKKKEPMVDRGVTRGKGSLAYARETTLRHIFDLSGGAFPGSDVLYSVFRSAFQELWPKLDCPIEGTVRRLCTELCRTGPEKALERREFKVPSEFPGKKSRTVFYYDNLKFEGPEVQKVVKGMIQAFPGKYCPPEARKYWREEPKPVTVMPAIDNSYLEQLYPPTSRKLDERIEEARKARQNRKMAAREASEEERRLKKEAKRHKKLENSDSRRKVFKKRQKLAALNDGLQSGARAPAQLGEHSPEVESSDDEDDGPSGHVSALMAPTTSLHPSTHTFSTGFAVYATAETGGSAQNSRKRVRIDDRTDKAPRKRPRKPAPKKKLAKRTGDDFLARHNIVIEEDESSDDNDDGPFTITERLAGLTGNLNEPDFVPRRKNRKHNPSVAAQENKRRRDLVRRKKDQAKRMRVPEAFNPLEEFRKLCYTLVIASSMAGDDGSVDWRIVSQVYSEARRFDLEKTKKMWAWLQKRMASQLQGMTDSFQSYFLKAYEERKIDPITNPDTYDWGKLVRWALLTCTHTEPPLPTTREALNECQFDLSTYSILDRKMWYNTTMSNVNRVERVSKYSFGSPLHGKRKVATPGNEDDLKARSLIRANISTPKEHYDKNVAHSKLLTVPTPAIRRTVNDLLQANLIKQRKTKRVMPGRNYLFSNTFAKYYRRKFDLSEFMTAVQLKKDLDAAFMSTDPEKRTYFVSRTAENGIIMALLSLVSDGKITLVPRLPPIKNEFAAPLPRISVWGFSEGDYSHRVMDRRRLFWQLEVVPTDAYQYGNPLQPVTSPPTSAYDRSPPPWTPMPEPPLPAREPDSTALIPIWSTIDGQHVIYPWWNRILNLVMQSLLFQPSITAQEVFVRCETYATEIFEIQHVLDWLVSVRAARLTSHGTYEVLPGYWAVFGDKLIDEEDDEFGNGVRRRKIDMQYGSTWRMEYNREYNRLHAQQQQQSNGTTEGAQGDAVQRDTAGKEILNNGNKQYSIVKDYVAAPATNSPATSPEVEEQRSVSVSEPQERGGSLGQRVQVPQGSVSATPTPSFTPVNTSPVTMQDVEMVDAGMDAEGEDVDAEGESDDEIW